MTVFSLALKLLLFISVGFVCRKIKIFPDGFDKMLSRFVLAVPIPCLIIKSFMLEFSLEQLMDCPTLLVMSVLSELLCFAIGHGIYLLSGKSSAGKAARFGLMFTNFTFFGLPVVSELYGQTGMFYYAIFTLIIRIIFYGFAPVLVGSSKDQPSKKEVLKQCFCPPVIAVFIGLFIYISQIQLPAIINEVITSFGNTASVLGLTICGIIIADAKWSGLLRSPSVFLITLGRLLLIPAACLALFLLCRVEKELIQSMIFCFAMPVASMQPMFYLRYNPEDVEGRNISGFLVLLSTLLCIVTVPVWAMIVEKI